MCCMIAVESFAIRRPHGEAPWFCFLGFYPPEGPGRWLGSGEALGIAGWLIEILATEVTLGPGRFC